MNRNRITEALEDIEPAALPEIAAECFSQFMARGEVPGHIASSFLRGMVSATGNEDGNRDELEVAIDDFES